MTARPSKTVKLVKCIANGDPYHNQLIFLSPDRSSVVFHVRQFHGRYEALHANATSTDNEVMRPSDGEIAYWQSFGEKKE